MALLMAIQGSVGNARAQAKEWWDLHADAVKIIENPSASKQQLSSARRSLQAALRAKSGEGKFGTYNPSVREEYLPHFYLGWANLLLGRYSDANSVTRGSRTEQLPGTALPLAAAPWASPPGSTSGCE